MYLDGMEDKAEKLYAGWEACTPLTLSFYIRAGFEIIHEIELLEAMIT